MQSIKGVSCMSLLGCCSRRGGIVDRVFNYTRDGINRLSQKVGSVSREVIAEVGLRYQQAKNALANYGNIAIDHGVDLGQNLGLIRDRVQEQARLHMLNVYQDLNARALILEGAKRQGVLDVTFYKTVALVATVATAIFTISLASSLLLLAPVGLSMVLGAGALGSIWASHDATKIHENLSECLLSQRFTIQTLIQKRSLLNDPKIFYKGTFVSYLPTIGEIKQWFRAYL